MKSLKGTRTAVNLLQSFAGNHKQETDITPMLQ